MSLKQTKTANKSKQVARMECNEMRVVFKTRQKLPHFTFLHTATEPKTVIE
jgi:hypothetical protein